MSRSARFFVTLLACLLLANGAFAQTPNASARPPRATPPPPRAIAPKLLSDPVVAYPDGHTEDVDVVLVLVVDPEGNVTAADPEVTIEPFSGLAARAALGWKFEPAARAGHAVPAKIKMQIAFHPPAKAPPPAPETTTAAPPETSAAPATKKKTPATAVDEVRVHGTRQDPSETASLTRAEVRQIPGTFGDPFRAIDTMPGVTPIVSGLPFFFIRGAPPGDVGYFLDGIPVPYLFHVGAGPSVIHPGLVDRVDLYPGGYPAAFGRYSGGIVSGETLPPAPEAHGEYNVRLFDAGALVETPFADGKGTVLLGGRYSYTALVLTLLNSDTVLNYWDYQGRVVYRLTPRDSVSLFTFGSYDFLGQKTPTGTSTLFGADFHRIDVRYDHKIDANGTMRTAVTAGLDETQLDQDRVLRDRLARARTDVAYRVSRDALVRFGTDAGVDSYDISLPAADLGPATAALVSFFPSRTDLAIGIHGDVVLDFGNAFEVTPGLRLDYYGSEGATAIGVDPRLSTRTRITESTHLLAALGIAHQTPSFVVPVPGFQPGGLKGGLQTAIQTSTGVEVDLGAGTTATATVFHNDYYNLSDALSVTAPTVSGCQPGQFPGDTLSGDPETQPNGNGRCGQRFTPGTIGSDRAGGGGQGAQNADDVQQAQAFETRARGNAYGFEFYLKRKLTKKIGGFLSYTLSRSTRSANGADFIASFDRTHVVNAALAYDLGRNWRAGTRVTAYTGLPKAPDSTDPTPGRLSPFFRVDLRLEKRWQLGPKWWISMVAEWMNVTFTKESIGTMCTLSGCQETKIGPVTIPSLGVEGGF